MQSEESRQLSEEETTDTKVQSEESRQLAPGVKFWILNVGDV